MVKPCRFLMVDGLAAAYRVFYAIRGMSTSAGEPTNALFGFVRLMQSLVRAWDPTHYVVVFDGGTPPLRRSLIPEYKANRKPMPDDLRQQLPLLNAYLEAASIPSVRLDECEADDVLATLAQQADQDSADVFIASGDKDLFQLVNDHVRLVSLSGEPTLMDEEAVVAKTGVSPRQIPDWLALIGDSADNISGVPGIGPVSAAKLLQAFGNIDSLYKEIDHVENKRIRSLLKEHQETVQRNLKVVHLDCHVPETPSDIERFRRVREPAEPLLAFYRRYEMKAFADQLASPELF